jgi:hypothetical protein
MASTPAPLALRTVPRPIESVPLLRMGPPAFSLLMVDLARYTCPAPVAPAEWFSACIEREEENPCEPPLPVSSERGRARATPGPAVEPHALGGAPDAESTDITSMVSSILSSSSNPRLSRLDEPRDNTDTRLVELPKIARRFDESEEATSSSANERAGGRASLRSWTSSNIS